MKSNANDAKLIAEAYRGYKGGGAHAPLDRADYEARQEKEAADKGDVKVKVGDAAAAHRSKRLADSFPDQKSEDGEYEDCEAAAQGCTCTDCPDCESNGASVVDQEHSCGYDQVAEPEPQVSTIDESEMHVALADLHKASKYAAALTDLLGNVGSLEGWTAVKIAKAADYLGAVFDKLDYDLNGHSVHNTGYEDAPTEDNQ